MRLLWVRHGQMVVRADQALFAHGFLLVTLGWRLGRRARRAILRRP